MPRSAATTVENNFRNGLITEASGLNFPESACTETYNCVFNFDGSVERRLGIDYEINYSEKTIDRDDCAISTFQWKDVAGNGDLAFVVVQVGGTLYFYDTTNETSLSTGAMAGTVTLSTFAPSGAPSAATNECQFSYGSGYLFVTHPNLEPFYVSYNSATLAFTATQITVQIRDFEGVSDGYTVDQRPTETMGTVSAEHLYNLYNQGWGNAPAGNAYGLSNTNLNAWDTAFTTLPSNADIMYAFKNSSDAFDTATVPNVVGGNSPTPKGHFVLSAFDQQRDAVSGLTLTDITSSYYRPVTTAFFAGRVFYAGVQYQGFTSSVYFSQIAEATSQFGKCYQLNDPTSEDAADLLPSDGGVIKIQEAGVIIKLVAIQGALLVFASNGVWSISGSTGIGFTANDYVVQKISSIQSVSAASFVDVGGFPAWWNNDGIYIATPGQSGSIEVKPVSHDKIKSFLDAIPLTSKRQARGYFNTVDGVAQWVYRSTEAGTTNEAYEFDRILNWDVTTGAFYPWTISSDDAKINSIVVVEATGGQVTINQVIDEAANNVINDAGNNVVVYDLGAASTQHTFKYLTSKSNGAGSYTFTFSDTHDDTYTDWDAPGTPVDYTSYFITGYKLHAEAIRKFQSNYIRIFSQNDEPTSYVFRGMWNYGTSASSGKWSNAQTVSHDEDYFSVVSRRLKVRGHGHALQYYVTSVSGEPFNILGWATFETGNTAP